MRLSCALVVLTVLLRTAAAQQPDADGAAQSHFRLGAADYDAGRYESALREFDEAYRLSKRAALLYNIGRCDEQLGRRAEAIEAYERYLVEAPDAADRVEAKQRIDRLRSETPSVAPAPTPTPTATPALIATTTTTPPEKRPVYRRGWFWGVMAGAAIVVAGGVTAGVLLGRPSDVRTLPPVQAQ